MQSHCFANLNLLLFFAVFVDVAIIIAWTPYHSPDRSQSVKYRGSKNNKLILHLFLDHKSLIKDK